MNPTTVHVPAAVPMVDPGITPNFTFWPFMSWLQTAVGGTVGVVVVVLVVLGAVSILGWVVGRFSGAGKMQQVSAIGMMSFLPAAIILGSVNAMTGWGTSQNLGF